MAIITIIGAGMMGSAMSIPATDNGHQVRLVGTPLDDHIIQSILKGEGHPTLGEPLPEVTPFYFSQWKDSLQSTDLILCGVSSFGVPWFAKEILPHLPKDVPVLAVTKGLMGEGEKLITFPDFFSSVAEKAKNTSFLAIGGPCTSYELAQRQQTFVSFCGEDKEALLFAKELLATSYYHISLSNDVMGVECAVALKNAYALAVSLAVGEKNAAYGNDAPQRYNPQAALFSQSVKETMRLLELFAGDSTNASLSAGDLYVTIFGGRTRRLGTLLGEGKAFSKAKSLLEGVTLESVAITIEVTKVLRTLAHNGMIDKRDFPLIFHVDALIRTDAVTPIPWDAFAEDFK